MPLFSDYLQSLKDSGNFRSIPPTRSRDVVDFSSNDYLGLGVDSELSQIFLDSHDYTTPSFTSSASRLLAAEQDSYKMLEATLSDLYAGREALLFNSGYHANTGLVSTLARKGTMIVADKLVHASIIDGITLSRAPFSRFRHNDYNHLRQLIERNYNDFETLLVIVESVYSMDGDMCDITQLIRLKREFPKVLLYVDEAHAFGVMGPRGLGLSIEADPRLDEVDVVVGTFGKAAASMGAFGVFSRELRDMAVNTARSFIFSTALPPICCDWTRFIINRMVTMDDKRVCLKELSQSLHDILSGFGAKSAVSHIQPLIVGDPKRAVTLASRLREYDIVALPIRVPTVPPGTDRLRFSLSAAMTHDDMVKLQNALQSTL